ncbi:MAG: hypothetical protein IPL93_09630 [Actinomycetales bacterium]|jgi:hypothetical protein|nr:hypothetical protein [Actinomycetales bacterium]
MNIHRFTSLSARLAVTMQARLQLRYADRRDRGDVPGWVLITVMTAGLVTVLWAFAGPALVTMFKNALSGVTGK